MKPSRILTRIISAGLLILLANNAWASTTIRNFTPRYQSNDSGNIAIIGNTLMTCADSGACTNARNGTGNTNNNSYTMRRIDIDPTAPGTGVGNTSTSADLNLPAGSTVEFAGVYWGAQSNNGARNQAAIRTPANGTYIALTANQLDSNGSNYHAFADVTALVQAAGNGTYYMADVKVDEGTGRYAGWSLVVVYTNPAESFKNLTVFDGYAQVNTRNPRDINIGISGFLTPAFGTVGTEIGFIAYEGDLGITGDRVLLEGTELGNGTNPPTNSPNSSISYLGTTFTAKTPNYINQLGYDSDIFNADGYLNNNATSATLQMRTTGDWYYPGVITTAIDIFVPEFNAASSKSVIDVNGGEIRPGDILEYTIIIDNTGNDGAIDVVVTDPIPQGTSYVPNSITYINGFNNGPKTDGSSDDQAEFDAGNNQIIARLGANANANTGGDIAPGESASLTFQVQIDNPATETNITNQAQIDYIAQTLNEPFSETAILNAEVVINADPLFSNKKTFAVLSDPINGSNNPKSIPGSIGEYTIEIDNQGEGTADTNTITIVDAIPSEYALFTGDLVDGKPYEFIDGAVSSELSCDFISLSSTTDCVDYSSDNQGSWNYIPNGSYDSNVTHVRFSLAGQMARDDGAAPYPSFQLKIQAEHQ